MTIRYLGIDWGEKRIGLSLGDSETRIATPFKTVNNIKEILTFIKAEEIAEIVLGKPLSIANRQFPMSEQFENFYNKLKETVKIPINLVDERFTSKEADSLSGGRKIKTRRDQVAAMLILQAYFDKLRI